MIEELSVSVVIPTHNRWALLCRALDSVARQSRPPQEIVVVDDGSTDDTTRRLEKEYPRVTCIHQENRGVSAARNSGIRASSGDWVAFLDSDDQWTADKLERQLSSLTRQAEYRICHTNEIWLRRGRQVNPRKKHRKSGGRIFNRCLPLCVISPSSALLKRDLLREVGGFDETLPACEDYDLWLRVCATEPVLYLEKPLTIKHGGHSDQLSRKYWGMDRFRIAALEKIIASGRLTTADREEAVRMLLQKIQIYLTGARKREKKEQVEEYEEKLQRWQGSPGAASPASPGARS